MKGKGTAIVINEKDNVATALSPLKAGMEVSVEIGDRCETAKLISDIPMGHKFALRDIAKGGVVIKYGEPIGISTVKIARGDHVHVHNVVSEPRGKRTTMNFQGYRRPDGKAGTRNHVLVIPSVGCSQGCAQTVARGLKGVVYLPNIFGCGQIGEDRPTVRRTLAGFARNPNVAAVLIIGLGCEELTAERFPKCTYQRTA